MHCLVQSKGQTCLPAGTLPGRHLVAGQRERVVEARRLRGHEVPQRAAVPPQVHVHRVPLHLHRASRRKALRSIEDDIGQSQGACSSAAAQCQLILCLRSRYGTTMHGSMAAGGETVSRLSVPRQQFNLCCCEHL